MTQDFNYTPWYGLLVVGGLTLAGFIAFLIWRNKQLPNYQFWILIPLMTVCALYGGRWTFLILNPSSYTSAIDIFIPFGGRTIMGCVLFSVLGIWIYIKNWGGTEIEFRVAFDILIPSLLLGQAIGRWGNFLNQEVYGQVVDSLSFLPKFIQEGMFIDSNYRQPLFLYESVGTLFGWFLLLFLVRNISKLKIGVAGALYFVWYGILRSSLEQLRDPEFIMNINGFPTSLLLSISIIIFGLSIIIYYQFYYEKTKRYLDSTFAQAR